MFGCCKSNRRREIILNKHHLRTIIIQHHFIILYLPVYLWQLTQHHAPILSTHRHNTQNTPNQGLLKYLDIERSADLTTDDSKQQLVGRRQRASDQEDIPIPARMTSMSPKDVRADMQNSALCIIDATVPSMSDIQSRGKQARLRLKISIQDLKKRKEPSYKGDSGRDGGQLSAPSAFPIVNRPLNLQNTKVSTSGFGILAFLRRLTGGQPAAQNMKTADLTQQVGDGTHICGENEKRVLKESSEELSPEIREDQVKLDPCTIPLPPSPAITPVSLPAISLSPKIRNDQVKLDPCTIPLPPSPTIALTSLPAVSSSTEPHEEEQIRPSSEQAKPEENDSPDQYFSLCSLAANDLLASQTSGSDGRSHQSPPALSTSAWTTEEMCTSPTVSSVEDEIIVSPVSFQDSKAGLMMEGVDGGERVDLGGKVQQPAYNRNWSASPEFQKAEMGFSREKRGNDKSWRRRMTNLSETLNRRSSSSKSPPTSYDAYMTHQRRIAGLRQACAPTVYRTAAQAVRGAINDLEEEDELAETFFLS
ncbi:hypothetical protein C361_02102 [Cryptococcus neoformans Tu259-1]|uniref:Uncharacterized protein n=1 Tax=Cryptococcus neoformans Tu259-1 TaxID=1230072 RepID=A0A854QN06_CRYNE|nr:hypothetical protein C361_02102 [Cryptococcus neoformans var. grubii Tu259-1]